MTPKAADNKQREWDIGVSTWIIQDGNYPDFIAGQNARFALEFWSEKGLSLSQQKTVSSRHLGEGNYEVVAKVILKTEAVCVIDFGLLAFQELESALEIKEGDLVEGKIGLGIDPFFYFEQLSKQPGMPPLTYSWNVNAISKVTVPLIDHPTQKRTLIADTAREVAETITRTDASHDEKQGTACHYILHCSLIEGPQLP